MKKNGIGNIRKDYVVDQLNREDLAENPIEQFRRWFQEVLQSDLAEPNAMALATASASGIPSLRMVLLKSFDENGFVFFTNYDSRKGQALAENPNAALLFWWGFLERQIRIEGRVEKISPGESDAYFQERPRDSQLGAWASQQSRPLDGRDILENRFSKYAQEFVGKSIERPHYWGGFRIIPQRMEFWQGRASRLHDRFVYLNESGKIWQMERLFP